MNAYLQDTIKVFRQYKSLADRAVQPLSDEAFFFRPAPHVNPIAVVVKHVGGNLRSRWTDFLTTDGEKPTRDRDGEFRLTEQDARAIEDQHRCPGAPSNCG